MAGITATKTLTIDAGGVYYRELNARLREATEQGYERIELYNVNGQRYIGTNLRRPVEIVIHGTPGNDLAAFADGLRITVHGNAQDGCGNTMNGGEIVIHGRAGDILGYSMRGGRIFVRDDVGYRAAIHMKEYGDQKPVIVVGGSAQHFVGEYMAGGTLVLLDLEGRGHQAEALGTGMHGGLIYIRGHIDKRQLGREVGVEEPSPEEFAGLRALLADYAQRFDLDLDAIVSQPFLKLYPQSLRPYGRLYAY